MKTFLTWLALALTGTFLVLCGLGGAEVGGLCTAIALCDDPDEEDDFEDDLEDGDFDSFE
jgi:hypothetical protein